MSFNLSPAVRVREFDLTTTIPNLATTITGAVFKAKWGPAFQRKLTTNERDMVNYWGVPESAYARDWFVLNQFLYYSNHLYVVRVVDATTAKNAQLAVLDDGLQKLSHGTVTGTFQVAETITGGTSSATAEIVSIETNYLVVKSITGGPFVDTETLTGGTSSATADLNADPVDYGAEAPGAAVYVPNDDFDDPTVSFGDEERFRIMGKYPGTWGNTNIKVAISNASDFATANIDTGITFAANFTESPDTGEFAIAVMIYDDQTLSWNLTERFIVSLSTTAKDNYGNSKYFKNVLNRSSKYLLAYDNTSSSLGVNSFEATALSLGVNGDPDTGDINTGWDLFANEEEFDVNLLLDGTQQNTTVHDYMLTICENRMDCMAVLGVPYDDIVGVVDDATRVENVVEYKSTELNRNTSYGAIYANWAYVYDKYNDDYLWIPVSGDAAGIICYSDYVTEAWYAAAGLNRGQLKNIKKLAFNPTKPQRDILYINGLNPVTAFRNEGKVIWGQKTLLAKPSAFDRINVRRLFMVLEKAISTAAKYFLFEFNDPYTRQQFILMVNPFLRRVKDKRGVQDFYVVCDKTNNGGEVIDNNEFIADIYIKPNRVAEFITLNFIATKTKVDFKEILRKG